jgi:hypothetical protein
MNNNLSLIGSEIIGNSNLNTIPTLTPVQEEDQKIITKTYRIINTPTKEKTPKKIIDNNNNKNVNKINNKIYSEKKSVTKRGSSLDFSKVMYNDGYILNDALNSNPGFGLWSVKSSSESINNNNNNSIFNKKNANNNKLLLNNTKLNENNRYKLKSERPKSHITNNISTIKNSNNVTTNKSMVTNDKSSNKSLNTINEISESKENNKKYKKCIEDLNIKCRDLEGKYYNIMTNYEEKGTMCKNVIKIKREYEKILHDNMEETRQIKEEYQKMFIENSKLKNAYENTKNEVDRLLNVLKTDNNKINQIREEYEQRLINEENERARLNDIIKINYQEMEELRRSVNEEREANNLRNESNINVKMVKYSSHKKDYEIEQLNDVILELELKISKLKKKIAKTNEENDKLRHILRFKEYQDEIERNKMNTLNNLLEFNIVNQKNEKKTINEQKLFINNWKKENDGFIRRNNNKLSKSVTLKRINKIINTNE